MSDWTPTDGAPIEEHGGFRLIRAGGDGERWGAYEHVLGISGATVGATGLSMDIQTIPPGAESPPHIHAGFEAALYILSGRIIHRFGARLEHAFEAGPGDFIYVLPDYPHQSLNPSVSEPVVLVVARTTADGHAGNVVLEIESEG